jgi:hypothetical protein
MKVKLSKCSCCGKPLDAAAGVEDNDKAGPTPGAFSLCIYCGHLAAYADDLSLRELTDEETHEVAGDRQLLAIQRLIMEKGKMQ